VAQTYEESCVHFDPVASLESATAQNHRIPTDSFIEQDIERPLEASSESEDEEPGPRSREGLPPTFRMRHGRHYVEELMGDAPLRTVREIAVADIEPPPADTVAVDLDDLERSIREVGVLEPLLVNERGRRYRVIAGMNRLRAAINVGLRSVPCLIYDLDDETVSSMRKAATQRASAALSVDRSRSSGPRELPPAFAELSAGLTFVSALLPAINAAAEDRFRASVLAELATVELLRVRNVAAAAEILSDLSSLSRTETRVTELIDALRTATRSEARLRNVTLDISTEDPDYAIALDVQAVTSALTGLVQSLLVMCSTAPSTVRVRFRGTTIRAALIVDAICEGVELEEGVVRRFFDGAWPDHPGGASSALMLASALRVARLHGGRIDVEPQRPKGCTITFVVPSALSER
jgi:hypothetical protein